LFIHIGRS